MPARHSKNACDRHHFSYAEKQKAGLGSISQRLGTESQLPFGYCCLSLQPASDAVVSQSGHLYSREAILEYLLTKTKEIKQQAIEFENQELKKAHDAKKSEEADHRKEMQRFSASQEGVSDLVQRGPTDKEEASSYIASRKRHIDDTDVATKKEQLRQVSPWIVQFTPAAKPQDIKEPPKRPPSPFSGRPLRAKDLIPVDLILESAPEGKQSNGSIPGPVRFICPASRKTITHQKVLLIKNTGVYLLESAAQTLAFPSMTCPITGKKFTSSDVLPMVSAASGFSASGAVEAKKHRPSIN